MSYKGLTDEQKAAVLACKSTAELVELASEYGYELDEDQLDAIAGGGWGCSENTCNSDDWC